MYETKFHSFDISSKTFLITGGAGFIGSNLVEYLLKYGAKKVRILDNLSNGYYSNIEPFLSQSNFEFIEGDIRDIQTCRSAIAGMQFISHQAALGSVPRSIEDPISSNDVNVGGFLNVLNSARESKDLIKLVYAASSSTYGDSEKLPKIEGEEGNPLSPYAVTKLVNEIYADVFSKVYGFHTIGLRYFNIFGPRQNPNNPYAAVIPIFCKQILANRQPNINGDGETSRDFTFVENAVQANILALELGRNIKRSQVYNVACGEQISLNTLILSLNKLSDTELRAVFNPERAGDVKHSLADISKISNDLNYLPKVNFNKGLEIAFNWYRNNSQENK